MPSSAFLTVSFGFIERSSSTTALALFFTFLGAGRLEHLGHQLYLGAWRYREYITVKVDSTPLVFGFRKYLSYGYQHTKTFVTNHQFNPIRAISRSHWKKLTQPALFSFMPSAAPKTSCAKYFATYSSQGQRCFCTEFQNYLDGSRQRASRQKNLWAVRVPFSQSHPLPGRRLGRICGRFMPSRRWMQERFPLLMCWNV